MQPGDTIYNWPFAHLHQGGHVGWTYFTVACDFVFLQHGRHKNFFWISRIDRKPRIHAYILIVYVINYLQVIITKSFNQSRLIDLKCIAYEFKSTILYYKSTMLHANQMNKAGRRRWAARCHKIRFRRKSWMNLNFAVVLPMYNHNESVLF